MENLELGILETFGIVVGYIGMGIGLTFLFCKISKVQQNNNKDERTN